MSLHWYIPVIIHCTPRLRWYKMAEMYQCRDIVFPGRFIWGSGGPRKFVPGHIASGRPTTPTILSWFTLKNNNFFLCGNAERRWDNRSNRLNAVLFCLILFSSLFLNSFLPFFSFSFLFLVGADLFGFYSRHFWDYRALEIPNSFSVLIFLYICIIVYLIVHEKRFYLNIKISDEMTRRIW